MKSLGTAVTGLRLHQIRMDVIANNIANVNSMGSKASSVHFKEMFYSTIAAGGTGAAQVGHGAMLGTITKDMEPGALTMTGRQLDVAIEGHGFLITRSPEGEFVYTRTMNMEWSPDGYLVDQATGLRVQGWMADAAGALPAPSAANLVGLEIPSGQALPEPTTAVSALGNLNAAAADGEVVVTGVSVHDSLGVQHMIGIRYTKSSGSSWDWEYQLPGDVWTSGGTIDFDTFGLIASGDTGSIDFSPQDAEPMTIDIDFSRLTQVAVEESVVSMRAEDGLPAGQMSRYEIGADGTLTAYYSNNSSKVIGRIALANFSNPQALIQVSASGLKASAAAGEVEIAVANGGRAGAIRSGFVERSNVDISKEFADIIETQRGFQANTRVISKVDEMTGDLITMVR